MKKLLTVCALSATMMFGAAHAAGKKATAVTQFQAVGSVITAALASANGNASSQGTGVTVTGQSSAGVQILITATQGSTGNAVSVPAVAVISNGKVTVTFSDGSSLSFDV